MIKTKKPITYLNRYTTLPVLLDMLRRRRLVRLEPDAWEDRNDSAIMLEYKLRKRVKRLFALCFSYGDETVHHWKAFADGTSGCCIEFDMNRMRALLDTHPDIRHRAVVYRKIKDVDDLSIETKNIPFTKRWPYRCEQEYRIIWEGDSDDTFHEVEFDLGMIRKITVSQRMPKQVYETIKEYLKEVFADPDKRINRSTLYENKIWIKKFKRT
jgi:hypothetical protein